jgi:hypothetical protein
MSSVDIDNIFSEDRMYDKQGDSVVRTLEDELLAAKGRLGPGLYVVSRRDVARLRQSTEERRSHAVTDIPHDNNSLPIE